MGAGPLLRTSRGLVRNAARAWLLAEATAASSVTRFWAGPVVPSGAVERSAQIPQVLP